GVGPVRAARLRDAGFQRIRDLLLHLPSRYEDRRHTATVASLTTPGPVTLGGRVLSPRAVRLRRRGLSMVRARLQDASGHLPVIWFNRPYLTDWLREDRDYVLHGELRRGRDGSLELLNPSVEPAGEVRHAARIVPIYPAAGGIGPARWRRWIALVLERADLDSGLREDLPVDLLARYALPPLPVALRRLHAPPDDAVVEDLNAGRTAFH